MRSIFGPFITGVRSSEEVKEVDHSNDKSFTPADTLTVARPFLAIKAAEMLLNGKKGAFWMAAGMAATDMEGKVALVADLILPGRGWGATAHGAAWDTYADTSALLILGPAVLKAPRVTRGAKIATAAVLAQEARKAAWAINQNNEYQQTAGERLTLPSSKEGKEAMAEKLSAVALAVATNETDSPVNRSLLTGAALYFAGVGSWRGEQARRAYEPVIEEMLAEHRGTPSYNVPPAPRAVY